MTIEIALVGPERHEELTGPLHSAFGIRFDPERAERNRRLPELVERIAALDGGAIVGSAGAFRFDMTTPGGVVPASGLTIVAVRPTHRRRGILRRMMTLHLEEARRNGRPISALWASEGPIYGRFGYGIATLSGAVSFEPRRVGLRQWVGRPADFRLLSPEEARAPFQEVYERIRPSIPGLLSRSAEWWDFRRLGDFEKARQPVERVLMIQDGRPEGYAIYRFGRPVTVPGVAETDLSVIEAMATSPRATASLWQFLCEVDLVRRIEAPLLSAGHPLFHLVDDPRRLTLTVGDGVYVRIVDAGAALAARSFPREGAVTFQLDDPLCAWNTDVYSIVEGRAARSRSAPELRFDAQVLGSLYLGGVTARQLADAGMIEELSPGAVDRADALFRSPRAPWCPEIF